MLSSAPIYDGRGGDGFDALDFVDDHFKHLELFPMYINESGG